MTDQHSPRTFAFWFYLFALVTVILVAFDGALTVASAHSLVLMVFMKQLTVVVELERQKGKIEELIERMDRLDPYKRE